MHLHHQGSMIRVHCQLMICRGHIRHLRVHSKSKYGLMGSSAKTGIFFEGHRSTFCIKVPFGIGHPQPTQQMQSTCMQEGSRVLNLQTEPNYLDSFKSYGIFSDFIVPTWSPSSPRGPRHPHIIPVPSSMAN